MAVKNYAINLNENGYLIGVYNTFDPEIDIYPMDLDKYDLSGYRILGHKMVVFDKDDIFDFSNMPLELAKKAKSKFYIDRAVENGNITEEEADKILAPANDAKAAFNKAAEEIEFDFDISEYANVLVEQKREVISSTQQSEKQEAQLFYTNTMMDLFITEPENYFETIKKYYDKDIYTDEIVKKFLDKGVITQQEYIRIVGANDINYFKMSDEQLKSIIMKRVDDGTFDEEEFLAIIEGR